MSINVLVVQFVVKLHEDLKQNSSQTSQCKSEVDTQEDCAMTNAYHSDLSKNNDIVVALVSNDCGSVVAREVNFLARLAVANDKLSSKHLCSGASRLSSINSIQVNKW